MLVLPVPSLKGCACTQHVALVGPWQELSGFSGVTDQCILLLNSFYVFLNLPLELGLKISLVPELKTRIPSGKGAG